MNRVRPPALRARPLLCCVCFIVGTSAVVVACKPVEPPPHPTATPSALTATPDAATPSALTATPDAAAPAAFAFVDVQVTGDRTCATGSDHLAYHWGEDVSPRPIQVPSLRAVVATRCLGTTVCGLDKYGAITCVGRQRRGAPPDEPGQETPEKITGLPPASSFALSMEGGCAVASGELWCWRYARFTNDEFPVVEPVEGIHDVLRMHVSFDGTTCVTRKIGAPACISPFPPPRTAGIKTGKPGSGTDAGLLPLQRTVVELAQWEDARDVLPQEAPSHGACAILKDGATTCDTEVSRITLAKALDGARAATFFDAGSASACVRLESGEARCTEDYFGESKLGRVAQTLGRPSAISIDSGHGCAIGPEGLVCWGSASRGQLGDGTPYEHARPAAVPTIVDAVHLSVGPELTCVVHKDGALSCWGAWDAEQSTRARASDQFTPARLTPPFAASRVFVGPRLSGALCAVGPAGPSCLLGAEWLPVAVPHGKIKDVISRAVVTEDNRAFSFGWEGGRAVTEPDDIDKVGIHVKTISPDGYCGVTPDGDVVCGHCGACNGAEARKVMTRIHGAQPFVEVSSLLAPANSLNGVVCARTASGTVECYTGANMPWGQSTDMKRTWERELAGLHDVVQLSAAGGRHQENLLCALEKQGTVRCLGDDRHGQRGARQKSTTEPLPAVMDLPPVVEIGAAADHACARTAAGRVYCWGQNARGGAPDGAPASRATPVNVALPLR